VNRTRLLWVVGYLCSCMSMDLMSCMSMVIRFDVEETVEAELNA
jgi:hypothetical protein